MYHPQLNVFVCVADCGSFSKAAEKLFKLVNANNRSEELAKQIAETKTLMYESLEIFNSRYAKRKSRKRHTQ